MRDLTTGSAAKHIFHFTLPMLLGSVLQQFYNLTDRIIVGRALGKEALAAVGASFPILFLLIALIMGATMGATVLVAQFTGAKDSNRVRAVIDTTLVFLFVSSLAVTAAGLIFGVPILKLLRTPAEIIPQAKIYLDITFGGMICLFGYNSISAILRGLGDSKTPLYFLIFSTILNLLLDLLFVLVFGWGIAGSAWATVIAQGAAFALAVYTMNKGHPVLKIRVRGLRFDRALFWKSIRIGLPAGIQQVFVAVGMMALVGIVNGFGTDAIAAFAIAGQIDTFAAMPAMNLSAAVSTFVGQNLGARKPERVRNGFLVALAMGTAVSLALTGAVTLFGRPIVSLFNTDPEVIRIGVSYLAIVGSFYVLFSTMFITGGALRGAGDTFIPMLITVLSLWAIRIPLAWFLSRRIGTDGIWWGIPIAWAAGMTLSLLYFLTGNWKKKSAVALTHPAALEAAESVLAEEKESKITISPY